MSNSNMEVKITLTPLGQDEKQNHRTITITPDNLSVSVGRASKNPSKGLLAAPDNAWFDYPILSRTHAKITASRNQQEIYLQDCGSTHGTYIDKQRLEAGVEFAVADGDVITFGQRVTSGAVTYPAKEFRVHAKWEAHIDVRDSHSATFMRAQQVAHTAPITPSIFTNDFDHYSDASREGSVQILESHRHTFFVPSSDDEVDSEDEEDEVLIASSVQGDQEEVSAATTPDRHAVGKAYDNTQGEGQGSKTGAASGETRGLNLKGPRLQELLAKTTKDGTTQENPINLEDLRTNIIDVETESEDDGPDILPFYETSKADQSNWPRVWDEPKVARQSSAVTVATARTPDEKENDPDSEVQRHRIVPETQSKEADADEAGGPKPTSSIAASTAGATDGFASEDDDGFDYDHESFADETPEPFVEPSVLNIGVRNSSKPKVTFQLGCEKPHSTTLTPPFDEFRPTRLSHVSVSDGIDVSRPSESSSAWAQRAPSPSDAALARKTSEPKMSLNRDIFDFFPVPKWPAAAKTTHFHFTEGPRDNAASHEEFLGEHSWPELHSPEPRSYDQGPFCQPSVAIPVPRSPNPEKVKHQPKKANVTWADPIEENDGTMKDVDRSARSGNQASKITIPSLVENYLAENPRSLKRKFGGLVESNDSEAPNAPESDLSVTRTSGYRSTFGEAGFASASYPEEGSLWAGNLRSPMNPMGSILEPRGYNASQPEFGFADEDTPLPDAQPRESSFPNSTASISQDCVAEPALGSASITTSVHDDDTEMPARKKARTSSSSSGGIGKFVMGVGFGLLGAAAAFVATIPASVYDEALREFTNAA